MTFRINTLQMDSENTINISQLDETRQSDIQRMNQPCVPPPDYATCTTDGCTQQGQLAGWDDDGWAYECEKHFYYLCPKCKEACPTLNCSNCGNERSIRDIVMGIMTQIREETNRSLHEHKVTKQEATSA